MGRNRRNGADAAIWFPRPFICISTPAFPANKVIIMIIRKEKKNHKSSRTSSTSTGKQRERRDGEELIKKNKRRSTRPIGNDEDAAIGGYCRSWWWWWWWWWWRINHRSWPLNHCLAPFGLIQLQSSFIIVLLIFIREVMVCAGTPQHFPFSNI